MPYTYRKVGDRTCVYKKEDGTKVGCTKGSIKKYLGALHANADIHETQKDPKDKNKVKGGLADNKSIKDIANKHGDNDNTIKKELKKGTKVEKEHTSDNDVAYEIAKDHTWEDDKYYEKLAKAEANESLKPMIKKMLREETELKITDETPDSINILVEYNGRNAGIIVVTPANAEKTLEIVAIKFKKEYETLYIINEAVKSLWGTFKDIDDLIVAPKPEGIAFWNKLGFTRISPNYLILHRGH